MAFDGGGRGGEITGSLLKEGEETRRVWLAQRGLVERATR
jgi:hypothetical protein